MSNTSLGLALALASGFGSALFHTFLKAEQDRLAFRAATCLICATLALPIALWTGSLAWELWPPLAGFAVFSAVNVIVLNKSYALNDFSAAYPIARGIVPLVMAPMGVVFLADRLDAFALAGIAAIVGGIVLLALSKNMSRMGIAAAILTGLTTIGYNIFTAQGMRQTHDALHFIAWLFVADGLLIPVTMLVQARGTGWSRIQRCYRSGFLAALITFFGFGTLALAMRLAPVGPVSALRETSVLIGLVLAVTILKERLHLRRIVAALMIVFGAAIIIVAKGA